MPLAIAGAMLLFFIAAATGSGWVMLFAMFIGLAGIIAAKYRDTIRKTVVILYELDAVAEQAFQRFHEWAGALAATQRAWHIAASGAVFDRKYHAGASSLVQRQPTALRTSAPPLIRTNVPVLSIGAGRQTLYFLPDRLLVYNASGIGAVSYRTLDIAVSSQQFIEESVLPSDATVVGHTWRYVNRNGGPDRRFNNNRQIPICVYDELHFRTPSGLNEIVQLSRTGVGEGFAAAVRHLGSVVS